MFNRIKNKKNLCDGQWYLLWIKRGQLTEAVACQWVKSDKRFYDDRTNLVYYWEDVERVYAIDMLSPA